MVMIHKGVVDGRSDPRTQHGSQVSVRQDGHLDLIPRNQSWRPENYVQNGKACVRKAGRSVDQNQGPSAVLLASKTFWESCHLAGWHQTAITDYKLNRLTMSQNVDSLVVEISQTFDASSQRGQRTVAVVNVRIELQVGRHLVLQSFHYYNLVRDFRLLRM